VLYRGEIVEMGEASSITRNPQHPYTRKLLMSTPIADPEKQRLSRLKRLELPMSQSASTSPELLAG
jgi:oligopeptide/dipeptide ABC transporter ATP-binding protein